MNTDSERHRERTQTGIAPAISKTCVLFGLLLIALALIAIPCSAVDGQNVSAGEALADNILVNQTIESPESPVNSTEPRTSGPTVNQTANTVTEIADTGDSNAPPAPVSPSATLENTRTPATSPANAEPVQAMTSVAAPQAAFSASPISGTAPLTVTFSDDSTGSPTGWAWYFGDETYDKAWKQQTAHAGWPARYDFTSVVLPDGSIILMGGVQTISGNPTRYFNDTWRSTDAGNTWTQQNPSSGWSERMGMTSTVLPDGRILLIGGVDLNHKEKSDVWISADKGVTWTREDNYVSWENRAYLSSVTMPNGMVLIMGGLGESGYKNDVSASTTQGMSWHPQVEHAEWSPRSSPSVVLMPDNSIVLMGGTNASGSGYHDVWRSTDTGKSWQQQTGNAPWSPRWGSSAVAMPDGSIVLMAGLNLTHQHNDVWRSVDNGVSWKQVNAGCGWEKRSGHSGVALPDGRIVILGGMGGTFLAPTSLDDVWQLNPVESSLRKAEHIYKTPGIYPVALQAYNAGGYTSIRKTGYITITGKDPSNIVTFGDTSRITFPPTYTDYRSIGYASAIRRDGSLSTFVGHVKHEGNDWVQVTNGAAITASGDLATWSPVLSADQTDVVVMHEATPNKKYVGISQFSDWLLVIYEDGAGSTHLEAIGSSASHPEVFGNVPTGTGWKMIAAGNDHALALKLDGTLVTWGDNSYGQLKLPANEKYSDIDAGEDFSLGLTASASDGTGGKIYAKGRDDFRQVTNAPKDSSTYIQIEAGTATGAALTHDGHILTWGKAMSGVPGGGDFTDISLGSGWGLVIKEPVGELHITGPLSPGKPIPNSDGADIELPRGSTIERTSNDITRIFDQNGKQIAWANDEDASKIIVPGGNKLPGTVIHYVPSGSFVDSTAGRKVTVSDPVTDEKIFTVFENDGSEGNSRSLNVENPHTATLPSGVCYENAGCSAANKAKYHMFLSEPFSVSTKYSPIYSVEYLGDNKWTGTLCERGRNDQCIGDISTLTIEKEGIDPNASHSVSLVTFRDSNNGGGSSVQSISAAISSSIKKYTYTATATTANEDFENITVTAKLQTGTTVLAEKTVYSYDKSTTVPASDIKDGLGTGKYKTWGEAKFNHNVDGRNPLLRTAVSTESAFKYIEGVTHAQQICNNYCVVAVAQMATKFYGPTSVKSRTQCDIAKTMGLDTSTVSCDTVNPALICSAATSAGELGYYQKTIANGGLEKTKSSKDDTPTFDEVDTEIQDNKPIKAGKGGHARFIVGTKQENTEKRIIWRDPACPEGKSGADCYSGSPSTNTWIEELVFPTMSDIIIIKD
ncbi:MAG: hypothetical protein Q7T80_13160 [Methanoregula sp.]|nr:hypothetical protein [Methanoregula sp.]